MRVTFAAVLCLCLQACSVQSQYVEADRLTFNAVAPEYMDYVASDPDLDDVQTKRRMATVESWKARILEAAGE